jgi:PadR family transcriptional regulator PadR
MKESSAILTSGSDASEREVIAMPVDRELMKGSTATLILSLLNRCPMHGYQIVKELEQLSKGVLTLKEGTLYPVLHTLERDGLVTAEWRVEGGRERKVYSLTEDGRAELRRRMAEWEAFRTAVDSVVQGGQLTYAHG